jgi:hypothetical protein
MLLRLALFLILLSGLSVGFAEERRVFVLSPASGAAGLLDQCSRRTPEPVEGFWTPSSRDITELETLLGNFLETDAAAKSIRPLDQYHRQYVGFTKGGKRFIYGNFYKAPSHIVSKYDESTQPVVVCDGGRSFWGIEFSLESKSFIDLAFNGEA